MNHMLVDAGNSRLKWALCIDGQLHSSADLVYDWSNFPAQLAAQWQDIPSRLGSVAMLLVANVGGERVMEGITQWVKEHAPLTIENVVAQTTAFGVHSAYRDPGQMGADRWAALVAARHLVAGPSCVIDCGTALTIDLLGADGRHAGGIIVPGLRLMVDSLVAQTHRIAPGEGVAKSLFEVKTTQDAMHLGALNAAAGAVERVVVQAEQAWGKHPSCIITGGTANSLQAVLATPCQHEPDWVLKGLLVMATAAS
jgi:type III pantothenate kinase